MMMEESLLECEGWKGCVCVWGRGLGLCDPVVEMICEVWRRWAGHGLTGRAPVL
jgi:hypothetical protein